MNAQPTSASVSLGALALPALALALVLSVAYAASIDLRATRNASITGDEPFYLLTTQSLIDDRDLDLREQYERESYLVFFDHPDGLWKQSRPDAAGRLLSPHEPGLAVFLIPGFALDGLRGAQAQLLITAALTFALAFVFVAGETRSVLAAWLVTTAVALTAPAFVYSTEVYPEFPAALCLVASLLVLRRASGYWRALAMAGILSALAWLGIKYVPLGVIVAVGYLWTASNGERGTFLALCAASAGAYGAAHLAWYGALTTYNGNAVYEGAATSAVLESHLAFEGRWYRLWGLFIDRRFGIARWAPIFLALLPAMPLLLGRRPAAGRLVAALLAAQICIASFVAITMMGWWFPGRMLIVVVPLMPLVLTLAWERAAPWLKALGAVAAVHSVLVTAALAAAGHEGDVRIAVDPFSLQSPVFRWPAFLFPDYRWWDRETYALTAAWLAALIVTGIVFARPRMPTARIIGPRINTSSRARPARISVSGGINEP